MKRREADFSDLAGKQSMEAVSLDVFDTCLVRLLEQPTDIFDLLGFFVQKVSGMPAREFAQRRKDTEDALRKFHLQAGDREDVTLEAIYGELARVAHWDGEFCNQVRDMEKHLEALFLRPVPEILERVKAWQKQGIPMAYASEMYMHSHDLEGILHKAGFPVEGVPVFTSGETGLSKGTGKLFQLLTAKLGTSAILHIGDNPVSDGQVPRENGLETCLVRTAKAVYPDLLSNVLHALRTEPGCGTLAGFWERFGYTVAGPLQVAFASHVYKHLRDTGRDHVYFLSRDGWFPRKVFRKLQESWGQVARDDYLYLSREFLGLGSMDEITATDWDFILKPSPLLRLRDVFERIGIPPGHYEPVCKGCGLGDPNRRISHHWGFLDPSFRDHLYHAICQCLEPFHAYREAVSSSLRDYLAASGLFENKSLFVDVGWSGSSFRALSRLSPGSNGPRGAYFALLGEGIDGTTEYFTAEARQERSRVLEGSVALMEFLFGSPEPTIRYMERQHGQWHPVFRNELPEYNIRAWTQIETGIMAFTRRFLEIMALAPESDGAPFVEDILRQLVFFPDAETLQYLGKVSHGEGWGTDHSLRLLPGFKAPPSPGVLHEAFAYCPWRPGLARMVDTFSH